MRRRAALTDSGSLELLLDTMCNAFGGVMFIAMLLAVLAQFADVTSDQQAESASAPRLRRELTHLQSELDTLRIARSHQEDLLGMLKSLIPLQREYEGLTARNAQLEKELKGLREALKAARERGDKEDSELRGLARERDRLKVELAAAEAAVKQAGKAEQRRITAAGGEGRAVGESRKTTNWFLVKGNRLYFTRLPQAGGRGPVNLADVEHQQEGPAHRFEAKEGQGIPLDGPGWKNAPKIRDLLRHLSTEDNSLQFAVYSDSYESFRKVREFLVEEKNYEYNWHPMPLPDYPLLLKPGRADVQQKRGG